MNKILVICKPSNWADRSVEANLQHSESVRKVHDVLADLDFNYKIKSEINKNIEGYDLILTVGGDGTLLYASHYVGMMAPILAVNSAPNHSEGFFCGCNADDLFNTLQAYKYHDYTKTTVTRMRVSVDTGKEVHIVSNRGLNDALYCHENPALTTRYTIEPENKMKEKQMSSGIWFSTAVGSTAAMRSAGGFTMPHDNKNIQYLVREPYQPRGNRYKITHGFLRPKEKIRVTGNINGGLVHVDGAHIVHPVKEDSTLIVEKSDESLDLINFRI